MKQLFIVIAMIPFVACRQVQFNYPETRKTDTTDNYFGTLVPDPYRWLEDDRSPETEEWVKAQNEFTFSYLDKIPYREKLQKRIRELVNYPKSGIPRKKGRFYFIQKNDGLQNQYVYYMTDDLEREPEVFIDPNILSEEGTIAVSDVKLSDDSRYAAYGVARAGSDWKEIFIRDMETGEDLEDHIKWVKFAGVAWYGNGFYYSRFEEPREGEEYSGKNLNNKVYYHRIGTPPEQDELVYWDPDHNDLTYIPLIIRGSHYLLLYTFESTSGNALIAADLRDEKRDFRMVLEGFENNYNPVGLLGDSLFVHTDEDAENYRIAFLDLRNTGSGLKDIVAGQKDRVISAALIAGGKLVVQFQKDAMDLLSVYQSNGVWIRDIELPGPGSISAISGDQEDPLLFYSYESFITPTVIFVQNLKTGSSRVFFKTRVDFDESQYITRQVFYESLDGTRIPMFIVHRKDVQLNGKNPLMLTAYGGFNVIKKPEFGASRVVWFENGGIYALANLRGGGEYGEAWHRSGMVLNKQNVFDDFIAAAEYLIGQGYTSPDYLAISGASNGGLLVGAVINQRPELFRVAFPAVGVMDMLRFHKFTIGYYWTVEYGSSDDSVQFEYLYKYSPLHNIRSAVNYPAVLIETADHDDRVVPAHSFKYAATLQEHYKGPNPVLIRIETEAGHGAGTPINKAIYQLADVYAFAFSQIGIDPVY